MFIAALVVSQSSADALPDIRYMQHAAYLAGSARKDTQAAGGFGRSDNFPGPIKALGGSGFTARLTSLKDTVTLTLVNTGLQDAWLKAGDSNILGWLEAKDNSGQWRPIDWHSFYSCGNSYHRVCASSRTGWRFQVRLPQGGPKRRVRWRYGNDKDLLLSNEIDFPLSQSRFGLSPAMRRKGSIVDYGRPTFVWKLL